jgi:hypothetical protein
MGAGARYRSPTEAYVRTIGYRALLPLVLLSAVGCTTEREASIWDDWTVGPDPLLVIGDPYAPDQSLHMVAGLGRLPDGRVVVANMGSGELLAYTPDGALDWKVGRQGGGPGEFGLLFDLDIRDDTVFAWDRGNVRIATVSAEGEILHEQRLDLVGGLPIADYNMVGLLGDTVVVLSRYGAPMLPPGPTGVVWEDFPVLLYHRDGEFLDTIAYGGQEYWRVPDGIQPPPLFRPRPSNATGGGRLFTGSGESWSIEVYTVSGPDGVFRLDRELEPLDDAEVAATFDHLVDETVGAGAPAWLRNEYRSTLEDLVLPDRKPAYGALVADDLGYLWACEFRQLREYARPGPRTWTVFDPDGRWVTDLVLPGIDVYQIGEDFVLGWRLGEMDVEEVVLYPLTRGPARAGSD